MEGPHLRRRYSLGAKIGEGGMGAVFAAEDLRLKRKVAIKVIAGHDTSESQERFRREAMSAARIAHPHIAAVQDFVPGEDGEPAMIVMELLEGETLAALLLRESALPPGRALDIAAQAASALAAAHAAGIVHRDIKPANLYLVKSSAAGDFVKILDFGIAKIDGARGITKTDEIVGTVEFMAPEQATGGKLGPACDVFSLGVVLYRMLTGTLPYTERSMNEIMVALAEGDLVPIEERAPDLSPEVAALVTRALAHDPAARFRDGAELLAALDTVRGRSVRTAPVPDAPSEATSKTIADATTASGTQQYAVLGRLASGGMAELFLARATSEGVERYVVLKRVLASRGVDPRFRQMFLDEAKLAAQLRHHNIAQVLDVGRLGDELFIALEYVHGVDVRAVMKTHVENERLLPIGSALHIAVGTAAGLHHAHERRGTDGKSLGIIHRDVSPANIMVSFDGAVKVVDFGIAKAMNRTVDTRDGSIKGKLTYMSPEQCHGADDLDRRSDVFSLGIVLYEMLTSTRLFQRSSDFATMQAIVEGTIAPPSTLRAEISPRLDHVVMKALERDRDRRYATATALLEDLEVAAARDGIALSGSVTGRHLRNLFGDPQEPWSDVEDRHVELVTLTNESTLESEAPEPTISMRGGPTAPSIEVVEHTTLLDSSIPTERGVIAVEALRTLPVIAVSARRTLQGPAPAPAIAKPPIDAPRTRRFIGGVAAIVLAAGAGVAFVLVSFGGDPEPAPVVADPVAIDAAVAAVTIGADVDAAIAIVPVDAAIVAAAPIDAAAAITPRAKATVDPELAAAIRSAAAAEDYGTALANCAKLAAHNADTASTCTIAACGAGQPRVAKRYASKLSASRRAGVAQACSARGVVIE